MIPARSCTVEQMRECGGPWRRSRLRQCKFLNVIVEQDRRRVKCLVRPRLGLGGFYAASQPPAGYELMLMMRKVRRSDDHDIQAYATFIAELFDVAA